MPYVKQERRAALDLAVQAMKCANVVADGDLNYILFAYAKYHVDRKYGALKNFRAELREAADEIGRRLLAPYEDRKIEENGDV